jgi:hypothetical protein
MRSCMHPTRIRHGVWLREVTKRGHGASRPARRRRWLTALACLRGHRWVPTTRSHRSRRRSSPAPKPGRVRRAPASSQCVGTPGRRARQCDRGGCDRLKSQDRLQSQHARQWAAACASSVPVGRGPQEAPVLDVASALHPQPLTGAATRPLRSTARDGAWRAAHLRCLRIRSQGMTPTRGAHSCHRASRPARTSGS